MAFKGLYAYVDSAQTNLEQRIKRHIRKKRRLFWHIDYLLNDNVARIAKCSTSKADKTEECDLAEVIGERD